MNLADEYTVSKIIFLASFVTLLIEIIVATDVFVPVDWNNALIPSFVYFLAVRHVKKSKTQRWREERLLLVKIARWHLAISAGLSFLFHLRELLGPCGVSHKSLLETCAGLSDASDREEISRCHAFLRNVNSYYVDQNKCAWVVFGNFLGSLFYALLFAVRVGMAVLGPAYVHLSHSGDRQAPSINLYDFQSLLYVCGISLVALCLLIETMTSVAAHYPLFDVDPCVFYLLGAYIYFDGRTEKNGDLKNTLWRLCVSVTFLYSAADFLRNYLLYHVSICGQNYDVDQLCTDGEIDRCLKRILRTSETISKLFDCPINKLGPWKASIVRNCQMSRFLFLIFHQGLTLAFGRTNERCNADRNEYTKRKNVAVAEETFKGVVTVEESSARQRANTNS